VPVKAAIKNKAVKICLEAVLGIMSLLRNNNNNAAAAAVVV